MIGLEDKKLLNMAIDNLQRKLGHNPCFNRFSEEEFKKDVKKLFVLYKQIHAEAEKI